ncbi:2-dehydropantoate 2-reductase [Variovorax sp. J22R133]|uniref:2-dehydropantoate 2-reductase n=1 Tax=Variovorax brevis TaxID=3053503 RepID=UPI00257531A1|nr:2-dehydropantoate 2-reductase [Variovorax sp. J22R133]MDM0112708.1 2-dehydropantoate 2-reductase [Variovorax sp. J22R133]
MGAGAIGCFLGGSLAAAGVPVTFVGRQRTIDALSQKGLTLTDLEGGRHVLASSSLKLALDVPQGSRPTLVLLCVKSGATAEAAAQLAAALPRGTPLVSMQNGISNAAIAAQAGEGLKVLPGMVPYNVAELGPGVYHRGTAGRLVAQRDPALQGWTAVFERAGIPLDLVDNALPIQWGKLMLNLNNPVNALSGLPLRAQLMERGFRRCFAALIEEALQVLARAGIEPAKVAAVPAQRLPAILRLPTPLFRIIAARMLRVDAKARSSMADDLALGRRTEVDALCGEVVRLARSLGMDAPRNAKMVELLDVWPAEPQRLASRQMLAALKL